MEPVRYALIEVKMTAAQILGCAPALYAQNGVAGVLIGSILALFALQFHHDDHRTA